jgi:hypothetical protein
MSLRNCSRVSTKPRAPSNVGWPTLTWILLFASDEAVNVAPGDEASPNGISIIGDPSRISMVKASTTPLIVNVVAPLRAIVTVAVSVNVPSSLRGSKTVHDCSWACRV